MPRSIDRDDPAAYAATRTLQHYFRTAFEAAGLRWESDYDSEIGDVVENLISAALGASRKERESEEFRR